MKYLIQTQEVYRVGSENEAAKLIEEAKKEFTVLKSSTEYKTVKSKGEIIEEYWKVTITKHFTDIKEPESTVEVNYSVYTGAFPDPVKNDTSDCDDGDYNDDDEDDELNF